MSVAAPPRIGAMVSFNPPAGLAARVGKLLEQLDALVIFDNGSDTPPELDALDATQQARVQLIRNPDNIGIAAGLNRAIAQAREQGAPWVLLLDHDSLPEPGMVEALASAADQAGTAIAVPPIRYAHPDIRCRWPASARPGAWRFRFVYADALRAPTPVDLAIGSGMWINTAIWAGLGGFDEALFIDLVDTDYCLRARRAGWRLLAVPGPALQHALGEVEQRRLLGLAVYPTHHGATRHYTLARNRMVLSRRHGRALPAWLAYEWLGAIKLLFKVVLFEPGRAAKLRAMISGTRDGLRLARQLNP